MVCEKIKYSLSKLFTKSEPERVSRELDEIIPAPVRIIPPVANLYSAAKNLTDGQAVRGFYRKGYPEGAVIHYTASHGILEREAKFAKEKGYNYFIIDKDGKVGQLAPLSMWGYHAGKSSCPLGKSVSRFLVGIEVVCAGKLTPHVGDSPAGEYTSYKTWWGKEVPECDVRGSTGRNGGDYYEKFTDQQEQALIHLLLWLKRNNPNVFSLHHVYGHNEVSPGRKVDPGRSMTHSPPSLRTYLIQRYKEETQKELYV